MLLAVRSRTPLLSCPCHNHLSKCFTLYIFNVLNLCTEETGLLKLWMLLSVCLECHFTATDRTFPSPSDDFCWEAWFQFLFSDLHPNMLLFLSPFSQIHKELLKPRIKWSKYSHDRPVIGCFWSHTGINWQLLAISIITQTYIQQTGEATCHWLQRSLHRKKVIWVLAGKYIRFISWFCWT